MVDTKSVNRERVALLVEALESGKYVQTFHRLSDARKDGTYAYCCLGVACEVSRAHGLTLSTSINEWEEVIYEGAASELPPVVREWYGFDASNPKLGESEGGEATYATHLNDELGWDFQQIAAAFRRTYLEPAAPSSSAVREI